MKTSNTTKKTVFTIIAISIFIASTVLMDQTINWFGDFLNPLRSIIKHSNDSRVYYRDRGGCKNRQSKKKNFLKKDKKERVTRVFTFGGSATWGLPYGVDGSFSRWFEMLWKLYADEPIEIINTGMMSESLDSVYYYAESSIKYKPDIWIIYSGNNELSPDNPVLDKWVQKYSLVFQVRRLLKRRSLFYHYLSKMVPSNNVEVFKPERYSFREAVPTALENYENTMSHIIKIGKENGVKVVVCTVPSNMVDWELGCSGPSVPVDQELLDLWPGVINKLRDSLDRKDCVGAKETLKPFVEKMGDHSQYLFYFGKYHQNCGDPQKAYQLFREASENDFCAVRSRPTFNDRLRKIVPFCGAVLADMEKLFEEESPDRLVGFNLFLDSCHPTLEGQFLIAAEVFRSLVDAGLVKAKPNFETDVRSYEEFRLENRLVRLETLNEVAFYLLQLEIPYHEQAERLLLESLNGKKTSQAFVGLAICRLKQRSDASVPIKNALRLENGNVKNVLSWVPETLKKERKEIERILKEMS